ncbi:MAG: hypothetical protein M1813_004026 [Trichoglossum hirsutum]|jgi:hypothetical protein|nr:MAG: hypothetical protein M1813_004026 [Trichoglossum hirsutum]
MNYVSAVYAVVFGFIIIYWFTRGKRTFRTVDERHTEAEDLGLTTTLSNASQLRREKSNTVR